LHKGGTADLTKEGIMSGTRHILKYLLVGILLASGNVLGATPDGDTKSRSKQALKAASSGDFKEAVRIWEGLLGEVSPKAALDIHANLAVAYRELGELPHAWHHLTWYLKNSGKKDVTAGEELQLLEKDLTKAGYLRTAVACDPTGATIYLGKIEEGESYSCPLAWWVKSNKLWVTVAAKGYTTRTIELDVRERGDRTAHTIRLTKVAPTHGELVVDGKGLAIQVFLDGALEGSVPFKRKLKPGEYELMVGGPGKMPWKKKVTIVAGKTLIERPPVAQPKPKPVKDVEPDAIIQPTPTVSGEVTPEESSALWKWTLIGSGGAMILAGGILNLTANSNEKSIYDDYKNDREGYDREYTSTVLPQTVSSVVLYGLGFTTAAVGATFLIIDLADDGSESSYAVSPLIDETNTGISFSLQF